MFYTHNTPPSQPPLWKKVRLLCDVTGIPPTASRKRRTPRRRDPSGMETTRLDLPVRRIQEGLGVGIRVVQRPDKTTKKSIPRHELIMMGFIR